MANEDLRVRITAQIQGLDSVESLKNAVRQLQATAAPAAADLQKLKNAAMQLGSATGRTENDLRRSINALRDVRSQVSITDIEYRKLTATINKYQAQLDKATGAQQRGGRALQFAQTAGAVAASGVFGGPEGLVGAGIGAFFGPGGALAGGAIGAQVSIMRQQIGAMGEQAAQIQRLQIALKGVTQSSREYEAALQVINNATRTFNVTKQEATQGFTRLTAAVLGAGGKVRDAELVFNGISSAVRATGGSAEDVQGALTAMAQVFSKGKVSAEELQGQLGERLPGAVTLFAESTGRTLPQLAKDLEQGTVGLNDLMQFVVALGDKYAATNEKIASSSESSGERLKVAFASLREELGRTFQPLGSALQDMTARLAEAAAQMIVTARNSGELNAALDEATQKSTSAAQALEEFKRSGTTGVDGGIGDAILQWFGGTTELEKKLRQTDTQLQASITRFYEAEGAVNAHRKALLASGQSLEEQGKAISAAEGALIILEGRLRTLALQNKSNTKEAEFYRSKVSELKGVLESVKGTYKAKIEIQQIFSGQGPGAGLSAGKGAVPDGYRVVAGKLAYQVPGLGWVDAKTGQPLFNAGSTPSRGQSTFQDPENKSGGTAAADKAKREAEQRAAEQQRRDEAVARARIQLDDAVFRNQLELVKRRYDYEQERIRQQRDIWAGTFEGIRNESARAAAAFVNRLDEVRERVRNANQAVQQAEQNVRSTTRMEAVTSQGLGGTSGIVARTGNTGDSTGAHLDLRWGDGRPITKADADKYFLVNGRAPSSFGVTSSYGPRNLFGRNFHAGIDFGTPAGSALSLRNGATFNRNLGNTGAGGYAIEVMTPQGPMRALHLQKGSALPTGVGAQARRDIRAEGNLGVAGAELNQARALAGLEQSQTKQLLSGEVLRYAQERTQGLRDQAKAMEDNNAVLRKRIELEALGMRPELIDAQIKIFEIERDRAAKLEQINANLAQFQSDPQAAAGFRAEIEATNAAYDRQIEAVNALAQAQTAAGTALSSRIGQLRSELAELTNFENALVRVSQTVEGSISSAISTAMSGFATGSLNIKQTLSELFSSIGRSFIDMASQIIAKQLVMVALNSILGIFGGSSKTTAAPSLNINDALKYSSPISTFAKGGVMTKSGPLPLKTYARGGIANSPQMAVFGEGSMPEAYVPLPDGRRIPVAMQMPSSGAGNDRMRQVMGASPAQAPTPMLNMTFETTKIGGTEYVSREQLESAMAETRRQAARDGAKRGMSMTLDKLQQSPSTRSRVGLR